MSFPPTPLGVPAVPTAGGVLDGVSTACFPNLNAKDAKDAGYAERQSPNQTNQDQS
jgi:hypothetical protein